jgi:hypothetical protein
MTEPPNNGSHAVTTAPQHLHVHIALPWARSALASGAEGTELDALPGVYVLVGDGMSLLTEDQQALLAHTASVLTGKTVQVVAPHQAGHATWPTDGHAHAVPQPTVPATPAVAPEPATPPPMPVTKGDFHRFALKHRYNKTRAGRAWNRVFYADHAHDLPEAHPELPPIRYLGFMGRPPLGMRDDLGLSLDLRSVYERLIASGFRPEAWGGATTPDVNFLIHLVNEYLSVEPVLPLADHAVNSESPDVTQDRP